MLTRAQTLVFTDLAFILNIQPFGYLFYVTAEKLLSDGLTGRHDYTTPPSSQYKTDFREAMTSRISFKTEQSSCYPIFITVSH